VANRRGFDKALQAAVTSATRTETPLSVIMMDFDRFKAVNDRGGHAAGDRLLRNSAVHWSSLLRPGQTLARFGGDEFAVLLPGCPAGRAAAVADHLRTAIGGETTCSAGVAELRPFDSGSMLVARADVALYEAKTRGRDRTVQHGIEARVEAARFSSALAAGQFQLCYQPIVSLRTRRVIGAEATLRWLDGGGDIKADAAFGAAAERSAAVRGIGSWIVRQACTHATVEPGADGKASYIAVSASRSELCSHDYVHTVLTALRETATAPSRLVVEISESTLDTDQAEVIDTLNALRAQGVRIAVDDFGISLASLSRLNRRPVDILKIDRSFVAAIGYAPSAEPILRAMVSLAEALGMTTVADGVDTQLQADTLADVGCRAGQGSMFGRPRPHPRADADVSVLAMNRTAGQ
jgi:diguanylate cyclase (GGDEF)-like protein